MGRELRLRIAFELVGEAPPQYGVREVLARAGEEGLFYILSSGNKCYFYQRSGNN